MFHCVVAVGPQDQFLKGVCTQTARPVAVRMLATALMVAQRTEPLDTFVCYEDRDNGLRVYFLRVPRNVRVVLVAGDQARYAAAYRLMMTYSATDYEDGLLSGPRAVRVFLGGAEDRSAPLVKQMRLGALLAMAETVDDWGDAAHECTTSVVWLGAEGEMLRPSDAGTAMDDLGDVIDASARRAAVTARVWNSVRERPARAGIVAACLSSPWLCAACACVCCIGALCVGGAAVGVAAFFMA